MPTLHLQGTDTYDPPLVHQYALPYPLDRYLVFKDNSLGLGDAGWDPDFPTTARLSEQMFTRATGSNVSGTIQVDPYAIAALLAVTGPVAVPGYGSFDSGNVFASLNFIVNVSNQPGAGKAALGPIAGAIMGRLLAEPVQSYPRILAVLSDQVRARHVLFYMHSPDAAGLASQGLADGAVLKPAGDYLMVADGNVGATKGDFYVKKSIDFQAEVPATGDQHHQVVLTYDMPAPVDKVDEQLNPLRYDGGAYHDYVRVYLPENANVVGVTYRMDGKPADGRMDVVGFADGHEFVGTYARVPRGHKLQLFLDYSVPSGNARSYALYIQKQAGVLGTPFSVDVSYPGGRYTKTGDLTLDTTANLRW